MTAKEAKEYLRQVYKIDRRIRTLLEKVEKLRATLEYHSPSFESSKGSRYEEHISAALCKIMEYEQHAAELSEKYIDKYREIERVIGAVKDDALLEVIERRYLLYQNWEQIADEMHYTVRRVHQLHGKALQMISLNFTNDV